MKRVVVCGAAGFIGYHLAKRLAEEGSFVVGLDIRHYQFDKPACDIFHWVDLRKPHGISGLAGMIGEADEVYQLAADMGGAGHVFTGKNDAAILHNNALININVLETCYFNNVGKVFFSSSACVYQDLPPFQIPIPIIPVVSMPHVGWHGVQNVCRESEAYPANPDSDYGWEKLFSERLYQAYARNYNLDTRIARFHNVFGPMGAYQGGREKSPAAICRKVAEAQDGTSIEIWGTGEQTRSFMYVDDAVEGIIRLMRSDFAGPVNLGSDQMVSIDELARLAIDISGKQLGLVHVDGPVGVLGRNSDNTLIKEKLGWAPSIALREGLEKTYAWIETQVLTAKGMAL